MTTSAPSLIRPMRLAELLDRAIRLYRQNFFTFVGIIAIPYIPLTLIQTALSIFTTRSFQGFSSPAVESNPNAIFAPSVLLASLGSFAVSLLGFVLLRGVAAAALTRAVANNYTGKAVGIWDSYRLLRSSWLRLVLSLVVLLLAVFVLAIWALVPCIGNLTGPAMVLFSLLIVGPLIAPVIVLENAGVFQSIRRAWDLARSRFWWLVGYTVVIALFGQLLVTGPAIVLGVGIRVMLTSLPLGPEQQALVTTLTQSLVTLFSGLIYFPLQLTILTVIYFDLRARSEGLDLALQLRDPAAPEITDEDLAKLAAPSDLPFITGLDLGRFALLSSAGLALCGLMYAGLFILIALTAGLS